MQSAYLAHSTNPNKRHPGAHGERCAHNCSNTDARAHERTQQTHTRTHVRHAATRHTKHAHQTTHPMMQARAALALTRSLCLGIASMHACMHIHADATQKHTRTDRLATPSGKAWSPQQCNRSRRNKHAVQTPTAQAKQRNTNTHQNI